MKRILFFIILCAFFINSLAEGWREGEKQIKISIENQQQFDKLIDLQINMEFYSLKAGLVYAYVIPKELSQIDALGFNYSIEIEDLNKHYQYFWTSKDAYHTYQEIIDLADSLETEFPAICKKHIFGTSMGGRQLAALKISDNVLLDESEAEVMFDGGIHGDEIGAAENVIRFARDICIDYGTDPTITNLIDNREIWLYLMVNPDGREAMSRYNNNGVDLNRDWCYMWDAWGGSPGPCSQVESKALRECMYNNQFVVHTTYHSGTEYISCPWSYRSSTPHDMSHILQLAGVYSSVSGYADMEYGQGNSGMYPINGSTKDSNYGIQGSISWSMEISYSKQPPASQIMMYYNYNKPSMLAMIEYAGYGLEGTITDINSGDSIAAIVFVNDYHATYSDPTAGDYHKYVLAGTYNITVMANGYQTQTINDVIVTEFNSTVTDFQLVPEDGQYAYKFSSSQIPDNNEADEGWTAGALGAPDMINYSIGKDGWVVLDMQYPVNDSPGPDISVHEGDGSPEGFTCYAGVTIDGPWISLGTGTGTTDFDIATSGLPEAQFIRIEDDGDGSATVDNAGFDLDAIEVIEPISGVYLAMSDYTVDDSFGNNSGTIDPGETVDIIVTLINNGTIAADNTQGLISTISPYLTLINNTSSFGILNPGESGFGTFTVSADVSTPPGELASINLDVTCNSGGYTNNFQMDFLMGQIPILIIDLDDNLNSGPEILAAIEDNGLAADYWTSFPPDLNIYTCIFVCLGIYSDNQVLGSSDGQSLADFLNNGGNLYMEGGDTWYYDNQTAVHSLFNIIGMSDGSGDLGTINGMAGTFTDGMSFSYGGENNWIDQLDATSPAYVILENQSPNYGTAVAHEAGSYRTIGASHEFGGLTDGSSPSTKTELMYEYLDFFGEIPEPLPLITVDLKAFLEGPFLVSEMIPNLNLLGHLPTNQPFDASPWDYFGSEAVLSIPNGDIVDWILVEIRETAGDATTANPGTMVGMQAGFILRDGAIVKTDGVTPIGFNLSITEDLYAVIYHRNHLPIISAFPLTVAGDTFSYDFTTSEGQVYGGSNAHKEVEPGVWCIIAGDGLCDEQIDNKDKDDIWLLQYGLSGYYPGDFNMNGQVDDPDLNLYWNSNAGKCSHVIH